MDPVLGVIAGASLAAIATYLAVARQFSGKVATSDASQLWEESRAIRAWSTEELGRLRERVAVVEKDRDDCRSQLAAALERIAKLETK